MLVLMKPQAWHGMLKKVNKVGITRTSTFAIYCEKKVRLKNWKEFEASRKAKEIQ